METPRYTIIESNIGPLISESRATVYDVMEALDSGHNIYQISEIFVEHDSLEPYWEAKFEKCSYGFRPGRSAHDAIQKIYGIVRPNKSRKWVLDADIEGAFDNVDHNYLLKIIGNFPARQWIAIWVVSNTTTRTKRDPCHHKHPPQYMVWKF